MQKLTMKLILYLTRMTSILLSWIFRPILVTPPLNGIIVINTRLTNKENLYLIFVKVVE